MAGRRILMVTPLLPHPRPVNGGEMVRFGQLRALAGEHRVTLLSFIRPDDPAEDEAVAIFREMGVRVETVPRPLPAGLGGVARRVRLAGRWVAGSDPLRALSFADRRMQERVTALLAAERFDLVQVEDNAMGAYDYGTVTPRVLTEQDVTTDAVRQGGVLGAVESGRWRRFQRGVWRRFDQLQLYTERDAAAVRALAPELAGRLSVNPFGIDMPGRPAAELEVPETVVFVGGFLHAPNVDAALWIVGEIMPRVWAARPDVRLQIVGSFPPRRVRALAGDRVLVTGRVPAVEPYLERAAVVLAPVRTGGGMRVKVLQAMAMGKAVVTTPLGAEGLWIGGGDEPPCDIADDPAALAASTVRLLADGASRHALGARARAFVAAHHSWDAYARRLARIHDRVVRERGAAGVVA